MRLDDLRSISEFSRLTIWNYKKERAVGIVLCDIVEKRCDPIFNDDERADAKVFVKECCPVFRLAFNSFADRFEVNHRTEAQLWRSGLQFLIDDFRTDEDFHVTLKTELMESDEIVYLEERIVESEGCDERGGPTEKLPTNMPTSHTWLPVTSFAPPPREETKVRKKQRRRQTIDSGLPDSNKELLKAAEEPEQLADRETPFQRQIDATAEVPLYTANVIGSNESLRRRVDEEIMRLYKPLERPQVPGEETSAEGDKFRREVKCERSAIERMNCELELLQSIGTFHPLCSARHFLHEFPDSWFTDIESEHVAALFDIVRENVSRTRDHYFAVCKSIADAEDEEVVKKEFDNLSKSCGKAIENIKLMLEQLDSYRCIDSSAIKATKVIADEINRTAIGLFNSTIQLRLTKKTGGININVMLEVHGFLSQIEESLMHIRRILSGFVNACSVIVRAGSPMSRREFDSSREKRLHEELRFLLLRKFKEMDSSSTEEREQKLLYIQALIKAKEDEIRVAHTEAGMKKNEQRCHDSDAAVLLTEEEEKPRENEQNMTRQQIEDVKADLIHRERQHMRLALDKRRLADQFSHIRTVFLLFEENHEASMGDLRHALEDYNDLKIGKAEGSLSALNRILDQLTIGLDRILTSARSQHKLLHILCHKYCATLVNIHTKLSARPAKPIAKNYVAELEDSFDKIKATLLDLPQHASVPPHFHTHNFEDDDLLRSRPTDERGFLDFAWPRCMCHRGRWMTW